MSRGPTQQVKALSKAVERRDADHERAIARLEQRLMMQGHITGQLIQSCKLAEQRITRLEDQLRALMESKTDESDTAQDTRPASRGSD